MAASRPVYVLAQLRIHDPARYQNYVKQFGRVLAMYGGQLLAADDAPQVLEGAWERDKVVLIQFASEPAYEAWASSPEYQAISVDRVAATDAVVLLLRGVPSTAR